MSDDLYALAPEGSVFVCTSCWKTSPNRAGFDPVTRRHIGKRGWGRGCTAKAVLRNVADVEEEES